MQERLARSAVTHRISTLHDDATLFGASLCSFSGSSFLLHRRVPRYCASTVSWGAGYRYKLGFTSNKAVHGRGLGKDMRSLGQILAVAVTLFCLSPARARFVIEQGGLKIKLPATAAAKHRSGFSVSLANFGSPKYGGELVGRLEYLEKNHGHPETTCTNTDCKFGCSNFTTQANPPFHLNPHPNPGNPDEVTNYIMLVDRGPVGDAETPCKFALKVIHAQEAGAQAVVVANYEDRLTTMEAPDDNDEDSEAHKWHEEIKIPAAFMMKSDADVLKSLLVTSEKAKEVYVILDWADVLPKAKQVNWEFWTNSNDQCGAICNAQKEFIKEFVPVAKELESGNWTHFTPHFILWVCPETYRRTDECKAQCIHGGRYCTPDPDGDIQQGYSGKEIVQENLRQLCVFKLGSEAGRPWVWWDYTTRFSEQCSMTSQNYGAECAERVFTSPEVGGNTWSSLSKLRGCIGDIDANVANPIFEAEMARQRGDEQTGEVFILPTIRINSGQYRGKLAYKEVLTALCAGFSKDNEPEVCLRVAKDSCRPGGPGDSACKSRQDGKTLCQNTFSNYTCVCNPAGYTTVTDRKTGQQTCLNINECQLTDVTLLDPKCTCDRCICIDTPGSYECQGPVRDECASTDFGGCWHEAMKVQGSTRTFNACMDNFPAYQRAAGQGKDYNTVPLHKCQCPPCFESSLLGGCKPKCDLETCDLSNGVCSGTTYAGTSTWVVFVAVAGALAMVAAAGYVAYRLRIRSAMHQEIRDIMSQYMPLESNEREALAAGQQNSSAPARPPPAEEA